MFATIQQRTETLFKKIQDNPLTLNKIMIETLYERYEEARNDLNIIMKIPGIQDSKIYTRLLPVYLLINQLDDACKNTPYGTETMSLLSQYDRYLRAFDAQNKNRANDLQQLRLASHLEDSVTKNVVTHQDIINLEIDQIQDNIRNSPGRQTCLVKLINNEDKQLQESVHDMYIQPMDNMTKEQRLQQLMAQVEKRRQEKNNQIEQQKLKAFEQLAESILEQQNSRSQLSLNNDSVQLQPVQNETEIFNILNNENLQLKKQVQELQCQIIDQKGGEDVELRKAFQQQQVTIEQLQKQVQTQSNIIQQIKSLMIEQQDYIRELEESNRQLKNQVDDK